MTIRVIVAEDQRMIRELVVELLSRQSDVTVVGEARSGPDAIALALALRPEVLILDVGLPGLEGPAVARTLRASLPQLRIIALTVHEEPAKVREMIAAGAHGYVTKFAAYDELVRALRAVMQGRTYLCAGIGSAARAGADARLGPRERQVVALIAEGRRSPEIAAQLGISVATVEAHRRNIMRKLGVHTVAELTRYALREGLTSL